MQLLLKWISLLGLLLQSQLFATPLTTMDITPGEGFTTSSSSSSERTRHTRSRPHRYNHASRLARELASEARYLSLNFPVNRGKYSAHRLAATANDLAKELRYAADNPRKYKHRRLHTYYRDVRHAFRKLKRRAHSRRKMLHTREIYLKLSRLMDRILYL
ncbi:MAG: hypothetical protein OXT67_07600 [Zetaproteobacteria bacterium]|nr:hypothetical protein [Zetaproteobacteria bacterium]